MRVEHALDPYLTDCRTRSFLQKLWPYSPITSERYQIYMETKLIPVRVRPHHARLDFFKVPIGLLFFCFGFLINPAHSNQLAIN